MDNIEKALIRIERGLNESYQNLCDKYENLKMSHNRKRRALNKIRVLCQGADLISCDLIIKICNDALFCDGRVNSPCINHKEKGEKR